MGGVLRYGIPNFRLPKNILEELKEKLIRGVIKPSLFLYYILKYGNIKMAENAPKFIIKVHYKKMHINNVLSGFF